MHRMLLAATAAAVAVSAAPAKAEHMAGPGLAGSPPIGVLTGTAPPRFDHGVKPGHGDWRRDHDGRRDRRRGRHFPTVALVGHWGWDEDRTWEPDSYNDWWHERPWRSYPRWVQNNDDCDRMWWGGGAWRCSW